MIELSIIIPTHNRALRLRQCLDALSQQTQSATDFEVIVVVDGSTDQTIEMLAALKTAFRLRVIQQANRGQQVARNSGVAIARGPYCLFLDDDIIASPELVAEHLRVHRSRPNVVAIGQITMRLPESADWFSRSFARGWLTHYAELNRHSKNADWMDCYGGNLSVPRAALEATGGFAADVRRSHDIELGYRLKLAGLSFVYVSGAVGQQVEDKGIAGFAADAEARGIAAVNLARRHPAMAPHLLAALESANGREELLRRALLVLRVPARALGLIGWLMARTPWDAKWYRFVRNYLFWRGVRLAIFGRRAAAWRARGTPILMYHAFGSDEPASRNILPIKRFAMQMAWLRFRRYKVLSLEQFLAFQRAFTAAPRRSVVITVDDGYAESRSLAWPILRRYGFTATFFLVTDAMGRTNQWAVAQELKGRPLLSWPDVVAMHGEGARFGAHTRTHPSLVEIPRERACEELRGSKSDLEQQLNTPVGVLAYPFGEFDATTRGMAEDAAFLGSCGVDSGLNVATTPVQALRRIEVYGTDSLLHFALALWLGYVPTVLRRGSHPSWRGSVRRQPASA